MAKSGHAKSKQAPKAWTPAAYAEALWQGRSIEIPPDAGIRGRILRGRSPSEFEILGSPERDVVFIMGPDGLSAMPGLGLSAALDRIGLTKHYVQGRLAQGYHFKLLVFEGAAAALSATWDNVLDMVAAHHPDLTADIERHHEALKITPAAVFEADVSEPLEDIELAGPAHPEYMSLERYRVLSADERANPAKLRRLLFHTQHISMPFYGDGLTYKADGQAGMKEYIVPNGRIESLPEAIVIDLFQFGLNQ